MKRLIRNLLLATTLLSASTWAATISGTVRSAVDSTPIIGGKVVLISGAVRVDSVVTDSLGAYGFDSAHVGATGLKQVQASMVGFVTLTSNINIATAAQAAVVNFYLTVPGSITGIVRDAADSTTPIPNALVVLRQGGAASAILDSARTDSAGLYTFGNRAPAANYRVTASATGYIAASNTNIAVTNGGTTNSNFYLVTLVPATLSGTISSAADSTPIPNALVILRQGGATSAILDSIRTDSTGQYAFSGLTAANNFRITASATGFVTGTNANIVVANGGSTTSDLYLAVVIPGSIAGTIRSAVDSTPIANALVVWAHSATGTIVDSTRTDASGIYIFTNLTPGTPNYWVTASAPGFITAASNNVAVANGATVTRDFYLAVAVPGTITGKVKYSVDTTILVSGAKLVLRRGSATGAIVDSTLTDSTGAYAFSNVAPGTPNYWITVSTPLAPDTTLANVAVANGGVTVTRNIVVTGGPVAIHAFVPDVSNGIRFTRLGDQILVNFGISQASRTLKVYDMSGTLKHRVTIPSGESRTMVPAAFAPQNGFLFDVK